MYGFTRHGLIAATAAIAATLAGCSPAGQVGERDDIDASFGNAKADGQFTHCQLTEVVLFASESTSDVDVLVARDVHVDAAQAIVEHRLGPDGQAGTADDNIFDDLAELDAVDFVGPQTLNFLVAAIVDRCEVDLASRPFITSATFSGASGGGTSRSASEVEAAMTVTGITGQALNDILTRTDRRDRSIFSRLRRSKAVEGLTFGYATDEVPWSRSAQDAREALPYLQLTIEPGRFDPDDGGERELSLGTDINDDTYFDTLDFRLLGNDAGLRSRVRWDGVDVVRRLLVAAKFDSAVDQAGIKRAAKVDVRTSGGTHRSTLVQDVMGGKVPWEGTPRALQPVREVYEKLVAAAALPDIGPHADVLLLNPKIYMRSTRSRFHFNIASISSVRGFYTAGISRLQDSAERAQAAIDAGLVEASDLADVERFIVNVGAFLDKSAIVEAAEAALLAADSNAAVTVDSILTPDSLPSSVSTFADLERNRIVTEAYDDALQRLADELDDIDRAITGTRDLGFDEHVDTFVQWRRATKSELARKTDYQAIVSEWAVIAQSSDIDREAQINAYNDFGAAELAAGNDDFEDFEPLTSEGFDALGRHLEFEFLNVSRRQIETAGVVSNGLWFEQARRFYVPNSSRPQSNFLIDTVDKTEMVTRTEWESIPESERGIDTPLPPDKVFHTTLVNEVQIELGQEDAYLDRIQQLQAKVDAGNATEDDQRALAGAEFVFGEIQAGLAMVASLKGEAIIERLEDEGAPVSVQWVPATASKGKTGLTVLRNRL